VNRFAQTPSRGGPHIICFIHRVSSGVVVVETQRPGRNLGRKSPSSSDARGNPCSRSTANTHLSTHSRASRIAVQPRRRWVALRADGTSPQVRFRGSAGPRLSLFYLNVSKYRFRPSGPRAERASFARDFHLLGGHGQILNSHRTPSLRCNRPGPS
jgi:hypothetical protein